MAQRFDSFQDSNKSRKEHPFSYIDTEGDLGDFIMLLVTEIDKSRKQGRMKIVDTEIAGILERL
jgi:hypothetical protein